MSRRKQSQLLLNCTATESKWVQVQSDGLRGFEVENTNQQILASAERNIHNTQLITGKEWRNSPIWGGPCRPQRRRRARSGLWRWTRRCRRWSSCWRPPPPPYQSFSPPSLTLSLWAHPGFLPFLLINTLLFFSTARFLSRRNNLVSSQDISAFLSFVFLVVPHLQPRFLCLPEFSVFLCFNWVVSGFPCVSWLRPSRGALHSSAEWSGREIVPPQNSQKLSQIPQDLISLFLKYDSQMCLLVLK